MENDRSPDPSDLRDAADAMEEILGGMWTELEKARDMLVVMTLKVDRLKEIDSEDALFDQLGKVIEDATAELEANEPSPLYKAAPELLRTMEVIRTIATQPHHENALEAIASMSAKEISKAKEARK